MIKSFENFKFVKEASVYPLEEWMRSHVSSWLNTYQNSLTKELFKCWGVTLPQRKVGTIQVTEDILPYCNQHGIEVLKTSEQAIDFESLEIWLRSISFNGCIWVQIGHRKAGSQIEVCDSTPHEVKIKAYEEDRQKDGENFSERDEKYYKDYLSRPIFKVVKNMDDVQKVRDRVYELYKGVDKKGYNNEFKAVAKELGFKIQWDLAEVKKLALAIAKDLPKAVEKLSKLEDWRKS